VKKRRNFLVTENSYGNIININYIEHVSEYAKGSKIRTSGGVDYYVNESPEEILNIIVGRKKHD